MRAAERDECQIDVFEMVRYRTENVPCLMYSHLLQFRLTRNTHM